MNRGVGWIVAGVVLAITAGPTLIYGPDLGALLLLAMAGIWVSVGSLLQLVYRPTAVLLERAARR